MNDIPDPSELTTPEEKQFRCDSCNDTGYHEEFDIDEYGELCNVCYKQNNLYDSKLSV